MPESFKVFTDFQYGAMTDLLKQLLTLEIGCLVLSVTFADKVLGVHKAGIAKKVALVALWFLLVVAILEGWFAMEFLFIGASNIRLGRDFSTQLDKAATYFGWS